MKILAKYYLPLILVVYCSRHLVHVFYVTYLLFQLFSLSYDENIWKTFNKSGYFNKILFYAIIISKKLHIPYIILIFTEKGKKKEKKKKRHILYKTHITIANDLAFVLLLKKVYENKIRIFRNCVGFLSL